MARLTECLPVLFIPKQLLVPSVWHHVVHYSGLHIHTLLTTLHAKRVLNQVSCSGFLPFAVVPTLTTAVSITTVQGFVVTTILATIRYQLCTAGMLTWRVASVRHTSHSLLHIGCGERIKPAPAPKEKQRKRPCGISHKACLQFFAS